MKLKTFQAFSPKVQGKINPSSNYKLKSFKALYEGKISSNWLKSSFLSDLCLLLQADSRNQPALKTLSPYPHQTNNHTEESLLFQTLELEACQEHFLHDLLLKNNIQVQV